ncbi:actin-like ATPase domain-containing protein [Lepidopterella palustris CBS 459.81]|uniref:Actin-like ATPase domain-containing protein n=1 Tax=Lepidopterella palustris CBS 459.81 TaxID=1314670 RepID=A0A8E2EH32_9PEZI|nr:actin-like ATPase domain-containing protein [Lepidopterella palustris CBS 459.81]
MPPFKDEQIIIIAPGSETTVAQLGLPESFTPARLRVRSRMFPAEKEGEWEPYKVRRRIDAVGKKSMAQEEVDEINDMKKTFGESEDDGIIYEEDPISEEGAVWPISEGRIVNWTCFFALMTHVYNTLNPPFHTPILLITQPAWTPREHEKLTQFFFEKFKTPAFSLLDAAIATSWAYGTHTSTVIDVGKGKVDVTAISEFLPHGTGRVIALPGCGGEAMTQRLLTLLRSKGFTREMCEQLKKNPICEILPVGTALPGTADASAQDAITNPAAAASTGATASGPGHRETAAALGIAPRGPGPDTDVGDEANGDDDNEGVLDVASIVAGGKMNEYLARKDKEKQDKAAAKKKGTDAASAQSRPARLPNSKRERATFMYEDHLLLDTLKGMNLSSKGMADAQAALDEGPQRKNQDAEQGDSIVEQRLAIEPNGTIDSAFTSAHTGPIRREIEVGIERFQAGSGGILERIADAIYRTISAIEEVNKRSELWDSLIICGNGSKIRGFKDALMSTLQTKYLISPSSATIFTSELPSNMSTPAGTGTNTPQPQLAPHGTSSSQVNPLLLAATTAQNPYLLPPGGTALPSMHSHNAHSSHGQTPTSIKIAKPPEYFPEWKDVGYDEAAFLGAQVAAKVIFIVDQGLNKGYMTRPDYNDQGPTGIHYYSL